MDSFQKKLVENIVADEGSQIEANDCRINIMLDDKKYKPSQGALSIARFLRISKENSDEEVPSSLLYVKISKNEPLMETYDIPGFFNEAYFYSKIVPFFNTYRDTSDLFAKFFGSSLNVMGSSVTCMLALENLQATGYQTSIKTKSRFDNDHLIIAMKKLGEFHAFSYKAKTVNAKKFHTLLNDLANINEIILMEIQKLFTIHLTSILDNITQDEWCVKNYPKQITKTKSLVENIISAIQNDLTVDAEENNTILCHGDTNCQNFLFKYKDGKPVATQIIDFANCRLAYPAMDILNFLYTATDQETRDTQWDNLIYHYYTALCKTFPENTVPTKESIINDFHRQFWYACLISINYGPYLMALDDMGENIPENLCLSNIAEIGKIEERVAIFKDMLKRNLI